MSVSVQIVTYNSENEIIPCLISVVQQTVSVSDIIVIDNASVDSTRALIQQYFPRVTLVGNETNVGFAAAHNQAIKMSQTDFVLVLNPDVVLEPNYLSVLLTEMEKDERIGSITGKLLRNNGHTIDSTGLLMKRNRQVVDRGSGEPADTISQREEVFGGTGAATLYRRKMIEDISLEGEFFDEDFFAYKEDVDVAWRSRLLGWTAVYTSEARGYHKRGWKQGERKKIPLFVRRHSYINRYFMLLKNEEWRSIIPDLGPFLLYEILSLGYFMLCEPRVLYAWKDFCKKYKKMIQKRRAIQAKKVTKARQLPNINYMAW